MNQLPAIKTLEEVQKEYSRNIDPINFLIPENINNLEPSELNRLYTMISAADGTLINQRYLRDLQAHINSLPARPSLRSHYNNEQLEKKIREQYTDQQAKPPSTAIPNNDDKNKLPRSRLINQFYSHQLPGINSKSLFQVRKLIEHQKQLRDSAKNTTELLKIATKKLIKAFPDVSYSSLGIDVEDAIQEDEQNNTNSKIPKCPLRFMESSIAIVLEQTENISIDLKRQEFDCSQE